MQLQMKQWCPIFHHDLVTLLAHPDHNSRNKTMRVHNEGQAKVDAQHIIVHGINPGQL
jgi:hypothetical protein